MITQLVFLLEERSTQYFLEGILPKILPEHIKIQYISFEGKQDLEKQVAKKIKNWLAPNSRFIVIRDQDSGDCMTIKKHLQSICAEAGKHDVVIRIACRELEAFFLGDWPAIAKAFEDETLPKKYGQKAKFRNPDTVGSPSQELKKIIPLYQKCDGAHRIAKHLNLDTNKSNSFNVLIKSLRNLV